MAHSYTLYEVNEYIRRVIALNFNEPIWIECEINQSNEKRGHHYLDLVQKAENSEEVIAKTRASIWFKKALFLKKKLGPLFDSIIQAGTQVKLNVTIEYHEKYGMNFIVEDIDPAYTMGQVELQRQKIIERLKKEDLLYKNQTLALPSVVQRIAIVSSESAAGLKDFIAQLQNNPYGYVFSLGLYDVAVQGAKMEAEITNAIREINDESENYDTVVIIRGGGSKLDLSGFDNYNIAAHIAKSKLPVITGIGHEIDQTVSDLTAHTSLKTPTAVASFIIDANFHYESTVINLFNEIQKSIAGRIYHEDMALNTLQNQISIQLKTKVSQSHIMLDNWKWNIKNLISQRIKENSLHLKALESIVRANDIQKILNKGFLYTTDKKGQAIKSKKQAKELESIQLHYSDGDIEFQKK